MSVSATRLPAAISMDLPIPQGKPCQHPGSQAPSTALRPILPRMHNLDFSSPSLQVLGGVTAERHGKRSRTNVTVACDGCKHARAKCDGKHPCIRCSKRSADCRYAYGNDHRQNRGSSEVIQALTARLSRYQRFVNLLCCSSAKNAEHVLHRLRSTASAEVIVTEDPNPPATTHRTFAAPFQFFMENEQDPFMATSLEEISALVQWIAQDLDHFVQQRAPPSPPPPTEQSPPDQNGCEIAGLSSTTTAKTGLTVQEFLC